MGLVFGLIACTDYAIEPIDNAIVGQWDQYETSFSAGGSDLITQEVSFYQVFTFQENGDMSMWLAGTSYSGSWSTEGSMLLLTFDIQDNFAHTYFFEFKSNGDLLLKNSACIEPCFDSFKRV